MPVCSIDARVPSFLTSVHKYVRTKGNRYNGSMNAPMTAAPSFAERCYSHTFASCGCGMCKAGDVCPTPILRLVDVHQDPEAVSVRSDMLKMENVPHKLHTGAVIGN